MTLKKYRSLESALVYRKLAELAWTVEDLSQAAGISKGYAYNLITGTNVSSPGRQRIEKALGITIWSGTAAPAPEKASLPTAQEEHWEGISTVSQPDAAQRPESTESADAFKAKISPKNSLSAVSTLAARKNERQVPVHLLHRGSGKPLNP